MRTQYKRILFYFIIICSLLYSQAEYQILNIPKNSIELSSNQGLYNLNLLYKHKQVVSNLNYNFSLLNYPGSIKLYNSIFNNQLSVSILDYGTFEDKINNNINQTFHAYEILAQYYNNINISKIGLLGYSVGGLYSQIESYKSVAIIGNIGLKKSYNNFSSSLSIENFGLIIKSYTSFKENLPLRFRLGILYEFNLIHLSYNGVLSNQDNEWQHILSAQVPINKNIIIIFGNSNYRQSLNIDNYDYNLLSGFSMGTIIKLDKLNLDFGIMNLGPAGTIFGITLNFSTD